MKKWSYIAFFSGLLVLYSCRKDEPVEQVNDSIVTTLDTNLYPGNFKDYVAPTFGQNTNANRNALIEEFTGHLCGHCPRAHEKAAELEGLYPDRVFGAAIHAGPDWDGKTGLQSTMETIFTTDFTTTEGKEMGAEFYNLNVGFNAVPKGCVNRIKKFNDFVLSYSLWEEQVETVLDSDLKINLQAESNYFPSTKGVYLHVEAEFLEELSGDYNMTVYVVEDQVIDWQRDYMFSPDSDLEFYEHKNVHRANINGETWGREIASGTMQTGTKTVVDYSYEIPENLEKDNMHFLIYVYDRETYEVVQVIKHEI